MYRFDLPGPLSQGPELPQPLRRPIMAQSPAGPISLPWPVDYYNTLQPELGGLAQDFAPVYGYQESWWERLLGRFVPPDFPGPAPAPLPGYYPEEPPVYRSETACPYGPDVWKWVLGTAVVMLVLFQSNKR
jgi:hypothetical protein